MTIIRKTSAVDEVFQAIQRRIVSGDLPLGHRFPPQEIMAEEMGVSRSTIREAINKLTMLGFLAAKPGVGTMVVGDGTTALAVALRQRLFSNSDEVLQLVEARLYLEKAAVRLAVLKAADEDFDKLETLVNRQAEVCRQGDLALFSDLDARFHRGIVESSKNQMLMQFLGLIWDGLSRFILEATMLEGAVENAIHYHRRLLKSLMARDLAKAETVLVEHLRDVARNIETSLGQDLGLKAMFSQEIKYGPGRAEKAEPKKNGPKKNGKRNSHDHETQPL